MQDPYDEALKVMPPLWLRAESRLGVQEAVKRQRQISVVFIMLLSLSVLGQLCPLLLLLAPLWVWTNHCTVIWLQHYDQSASKRVVDKILVQQPTTVFGVVGRVAQFAVALVVFVDLEFGVGPVMLYLVLFVAAEVGTFFWHRRKLESQQVAMLAFLVNRCKLVMPNSIQCVTMHNCAFISLPLLQQPLPSLASLLQPLTTAQRSCSALLPPASSLLCFLFSLQCTYNETRRQVLWKCPTNAPHEDCGLDEFSSREIPNRNEFS